MEVNFKTIPLTVFRKREIGVGLHISVIPQVEILFSLLCVYKTAEDTDRCIFSTLKVKRTYFLSCFIIHMENVAGYPYIVQTSGFILGEDGTGLGVAAVNGQGHGDGMAGSRHVAALKHVLLRA